MGGGHVFGGVVDEWGGQVGGGGVDGGGGHVGGGGGGVVDSHSRTSSLVICITFSPLSQKFQPRKIKTLRSSTSPSL